LSLETELRRALEGGEFRVYYQPLVALATGRVAGFEALVRWRHRGRGLLAPGDFIPLAEETGLILPLDHWVLGEACRQARRWRARPGVASAPALSVNLSGRHFQQAGLVENVARILRETGTGPGNCNWSSPRGYSWTDRGDARHPA
jgi:EAL domain-containing protein (putative c-di-GMP-specific phosphodiesterase class I)